jgi:hypothetical protein
MVTNHRSYRIQRSTSGGGSSMAKRRTTRTRSIRPPHGSGDSGGALQGLRGKEASESSMLPQALWKIAHDVEVWAAGFLRLSGNALLSAASGAADIAAEALTATVSGARGVAFAASRMVSGVAGTAQTIAQEAIKTPKQLRGRDTSRTASRRPRVSMAGRPAESAASVSSSVNGARPRRRTRRPRSARVAA